MLNGGDALSLARISSSMVCACRPSPMIATR
jgi:hypothetical protein